MKIRAGFVSNSSTASFVVKTRPDEWDIMMDRVEKKDIPILPQEKVDFLKKCGFVPIKDNDPFRRELNNCGGDYLVEGDTKDDTFLGYWMVCNQDFVAELLIAHDIPFKASIHYSHSLYSYDPKDEYLYILANFGIEYLNRPKDLEEIMNDPERRELYDTEPLRKISKEEFLKDYDEKNSLKIMSGDLT